MSRALRSRSELPRIPCPPRRARSCSPTSCCGGDHGPGSEDRAAGRRRVRDDPASGQRREAHCRTAPTAPPPRPPSAGHALPCRCCCRSTASSRSRPCRCRRRRCHRGIPLIVLFVTVSEHSTQTMPPPFKPVLPDTVLLFSVRAGERGPARGASNEPTTAMPPPLSRPPVSIAVLLPVTVAASRTSVVPRADVDATAEREDPARRR